jgi:hypothetical protein
MVRIVSGMAMARRRQVGAHRARLDSRSMRSPTPNRPTITQSSLTTSQAFGLVIGLMAAGMPGSQPKISSPSPISSADAAGSRPEMKRGSQ